ncbi:hypothetical protein CBR_g29754 [Chara braunii]|uniref:Reverse transcriptase zinc-binding domain-containing protein n=1 Tax=Chara braunii TaxID=69332 RepID=A0A388LBD9_CHABU|nr:hypothetical protein CBR_g29754 [Chara braunii]|eukprot:GBG79606.1 hypothetical protein CBR_g29754 [Chara braunii]
MEAPIRILGVSMTTAGRPPINDEWISTSAQYKLNNWKNKQTTLFGRALVLNNVVFASLWYKSLLWPLSKAALKALKQKAITFLWRGDGDQVNVISHVAWDSIIQPKAGGGLGILDPATQAQWRSTVDKNDFSASPDTTADHAVSGNSGTSTPAYGGYSNGGGYLGKRVSLLEEIVGKIKVKHDADEARELATREEEAKKKREREDEERRLRDKKEWEEFQAQINKEVSSKLDRVYEAVNGKKGAEHDEVTKLKARIEELQNRACVASTSTQVAKPSESDEVVRLRLEQIEMQKTTDKRFKAVEEVIQALQKQCEDVETNAEVWKVEALRPVRQRLTPGVLPSSVRVYEKLKGVVERHQAEVAILRDMRMKEVNARKQSELEVERLKKEMDRRKSRSNLKTRLMRRLDHLH